MPDPFNAYEFFSHLRARWRLPVIAVVSAVAVALILSLLLPKRYTARVTLVIEPPAASDPRASTAVSPIYLESLRTYEHFAASDHLFAQAVDRFRLRSDWPGRPLEKLKRSVLEVSIPRNTKVLEIEATLPDPKKAHELARYVAEETIQLNRRINRAGDDELLQEARNQVADAAQRRKAAETALDRARRQGLTPEALRAELEQVRQIRDEVGRLLLSSELSSAADAASRAGRLRRQASELDRRIGERERLLARRIAEIDSREAEYGSAWTAYEEVEKRLRELQAARGSHGERLSLLDPGVPPERPSFPNLPLNLLVAAGLAIIASLLYLTLDFSLQAQRTETMRATLRFSSKV